MRVQADAMLKTQKRPDNESQILTSKSRENVTVQRAARGEGGGGMGSRTVAFKYWSCPSGDDLDKIRLVRACLVNCHQRHF